MPVPHVEFEWKIRISDIILIVGIMGTMFAGWTRFDTRITAVEASSNANAEAIKLLTQGQIEQNKLLGEMVQQMKDYPLHIHDKSGHIVIYGPTQ